MRSLQQMFLVILQDALSPLPAGGASSAAYGSSAAQTPPQPSVPALAAPVPPAVQRPTAAAQPAPSRCGALQPRTCQGAALARFAVWEGEAPCLVGSLSRPQWLGRVLVPPRVLGVKDLVSLPGHFATCCAVAVGGGRQRPGQRASRSWRRRASRRCSRRTRPASCSGATASCLRLHLTCEWCAALTRAACPSHAPSCCGCSLVCQSQPNLLQSCWSTMLTLHS